MARSLIGKIVNAASDFPSTHPIPFSSKWNVNGGLYGSGLQDRFTQLQSQGTVGTLFAVIQLLSTGSHVSGDWGLYRKNRDGRVRYTTSDRGSDERMEVLQHAALDLWNHPNDFMTGAEFREIGWQHMELVGEWYWVLNRGPSGLGIPVEMWPVRPDRMEPVPDKKKYLVGWVYTGPNGEAVPLLHSEVIQMKYPCSTDPYRGMSAVQSLLAHIDSAKYTAEWSRNFFLNSATPGGIVQFDRRLTDREFNEFTARWREQHQGVARGHRVGVLEAGAVWNPNTYSMREMQFVELSSLSSNKIREAYRIHPSMMGMVEDVNRANAETAEQVHIRWHEITRLKRERMVLNEKLIPMFEGTRRTTVEFDFADPSPASAEDANEELTAKTNAAKLLIDTGFDPEEVLQTVGLPAMRFVGPPAPAGTVMGAPRPSLGPGGQGKPSGNDEEPPPRSQYDGVEGVQNWLDIGAMIRDAFSSRAISNGHSNGHKELV
jgi:HK97 family phage portal protein